MLGELVIMLMLIRVYDYIRSFAAPRSLAARKHGEDVLSLERLLHLDFELPTNRWLSGHRPLESLAAYWYQFAHIGGTMTILVCCYISAPSLYRRARNALVLTNLVGMTVFLMLPVMPPRLLPDGGFLDSLADAGFQSAHYGSVQPDEYAAMPSLHLSWALWTALVGIALLWRYRWRYLWLLYPLTTAIVVIITANHYFLDVVAGVAVALLATWAAGHFHPDRRAPLGWWRWRALLQAIGRGCYAAQIRGGIGIGSAYAGVPLVPTAEVSLVTAEPEQTAEPELSPAPTFGDR